MIFGKGALRISARELLIEIKQNRKAIERKSRTEATNPPQDAGRQAEHGRPAEVGKVAQGKN